MTNADSGMKLLHFGNDLVDIQSWINLEIQIWVSDQFCLRLDALVEVCFLRMLSSSKCATTEKIYLFCTQLTGLAFVFPTFCISAFLVVQSFPAFSSSTYFFPHFSMPNRTCCEHLTSTHGMIISWTPQHVTVQSINVIMSHSCGQLSLSLVYYAYCISTVVFLQTSKRFKKASIWMY